MKYDHRESGQVLLIGVVMVVILLVAVFILADVHNTIRSKLKVETAQQAAALAAAEWQRESLNLIGEINLIKASDALLRPPEEIAVMQQEYDRLTEMQTRVSFIGPLIAFAAAQQAAKANGINPHGDLAKLYLAQLTKDNLYYFPPNSDGYINNYNWFKPYRELLETISQNGIAVRPNTSNSFSLTAYPTCLNDPAFYQSIYFHKKDIAEKPTFQAAWTSPLTTMCKKSDGYYNGVWWDIQFHSSAFIGQSEIYPLYVKREDHVNHSTPGIQSALQKSPVSNNLLPPVTERPELINLSLKWFCYDHENWDMQAYRQKYRTDDSEETRNHYDTWYFGQGLLRSNVKQQFQYEGPIAYAETGVRLSHLSHYMLPNSSGKQRGRNLFHTNTPVKASTIIGAERVVGASAEIDLSDRPGIMAKTFGELEDNKPPHTIPVILPVFHTSGLVPTYMPRPADFSVLHELTDLQIFLMWLSGQSSLNGTPPAGTDWYLDALQTLEDGPGFRYYCWNPNFSANTFNLRWKNRWTDYYDARRKNPPKYVYDEQQNPTGPGWLQEPRFYDSTRGEKIFRNDKITKECGIHDGETIILHGLGDDCFYIEHTGKVVTNEDPDPLVKRGSCGCSGGSCSCGNGTPSDEIQPPVHGKPKSGTLRL